MKHYLLLCLLAILLLVLKGYVCAQTPEGWAWTSQTKGESSGVNSQSIATDAAGNTYVLGNLHYGKAVFGRDSITSPDHDFVFIAKYNAAGALVWAKEAGLSISGGRFYDYILGIDLALDTDGNIYVTGIFSSTITIGANRLISGGSGDILPAYHH